MEVGRFMFFYDFCVRMRVLFVQFCYHVVTPSISGNSLLIERQHVAEKV